MSTKNEFDQKLLEKSKWFFSKWRYLHSFGWENRAKEIYELALQYNPEVSKPPRSFSGMCHYLPHVFLVVVGKKLER